jgi:hypothetical protein
MKNPEQYRGVDTSSLHKIIKTKEQGDRLMKSLEDAGNARKDAEKSKNK